MHKPSTRIATLACTILLLGSLAACGAPARDQYYGQQPHPAAAQAYVEYGRVASIEAVRTEERARPSGAGAVIGAVVGGVVGNQIGGGSGRALATAAGAVGGAVVGNRIEDGRYEVRETWRISIQIDNGSYRAFDVSSPGDLRVGDRVRVEDGRISRV
ncbi:glycine zipper 2TM domain-containing protein [Ramlibacter sp. H39-3-26]|uniref:glycine zipper 2TM domain-containing protein n=1 Tax=Curvibacter soli TaxID=3031331 RepID=UPI0023D9DF86|nr:glycine zipper 2TM domain-containing protein [Ramlibacter sp. H39-3-26]MDF1486522.1 glycine zipper 2TM domain-containing protein [Ramlibacter sp. H39-3-26]